MAPAVMSVSPALRAAVIQCINQPAASPAVQQAAIQVYRLTSVPEEVSHFLFPNLSNIHHVVYAHLLISLATGQRGSHAGAVGQSQPHAKAHCCIPCTYEGPPAH